MSAVSLRHIRHIAAALCLALVAAAPALTLADGGGDAVYAALDRLPATTLEVGGAALHVAIDEPDGYALAPARLLDWVRRSASAVALYYDGFPVRDYRLLLAPAPGRRISGGTTWAYRGLASRVYVGRDAGETALANDWVLVHEMIHTALPFLPRRHHWLEEGIASYVEPLARAQAGQLTETQVWAQFLAGMSMGLPQPGDAGLDRTHTWARTYWGGALFCLLADVAIREETGGRAGLREALRAIARASAGMADEWPIERVLAVGDAATGTGVLARLYAAHAETAVTPDLPALWRALGIVERGDNDPVFDETAPLAALRRSLVAPGPAVPFTRP